MSDAPWACRTAFCAACCSAIHDPRLSLGRGAGCFNAASSSCLASATMPTSGPRILADVFFVGVDLHERHSGARKSKTGGSLLAQPAAEHDQQVAFFVGEVLRVLVRRQHVAGVVRMIVGEGVLPFVRGQHRQLKFFGEVDHFLPGVRILRSRTDQQHRFARRVDAPDQSFNGRRIGIGLDRRNRRRSW